jgi:type II secretory pathway predicted ATPase ExeA
VALVFEEAHRLPLSTFRHLKGLREDNKNGMKIILGVLLIGQTELAQRLSESNPAIREVVQRCELLTLEPLGKHLAAYIAHRFSRAGIIQADQVFEPAAMDAISRKLTLTSEHTTRGGGVSRLEKTSASMAYPLAVGNVATAAMNLAAHIGAPKVTAEIVGRC